MRVAIDTAFLQMPPSGTGTYLRALLDELPRVDSDLEIVRVAPELREHGGRVMRWIDAQWNDPRLRRARWELAGATLAGRHAKPDLLHIPSLAAPLVPAVPFVVTIHDAIPWLLPEYRTSRLLRAHLALIARGVTRARLVLTPSASASADITRVLGIDPDRIRVTPEAAGAAFIPANGPSHAQDMAKRMRLPGRYLFTIGGFDARKNLPLLIESFARVVSRTDEPITLLIGGAPHSDNLVVNPPLQPTIERLGLGDRVRLVGRVSEEEKVELFQGAAVYVTPAIYEGFGLTALEAMACGVPTIAANRSSLPEVVGDGGLLVEPTVAKLADAMSGVLSNDGLARDLAERGLARARFFSWRETARLTVDAYREAAGMKHLGLESIDG